MTDPELQALAEQMMARLKSDHVAVGFARAEVCAQVAIDFFAARLARADAIEQAARTVIQVWAPEDEGVGTGSLGALRAALEAS